MMEKLFNFSVRIIGRLVSICLAAALLLAWALTGPLFHLSDLYHTRFNKKMKETL